MPHPLRHNSYSGGQYADVVTSHSVCCILRPRSWQAENVELSVECVILSVSDRRPTDARRRVIADSGTVPTVHDDRRATEKILTRSHCSEHLPCLTET